MSFYASFQGRVFLGKRDALGNPIEVRSPGNVAELKLSLKTDVVEHFESQTGQRSLDHRMIKQKSATVMLTIEEFTKENLSLALYGSHVATAAGNVTADPDRRGLRGTSRGPYDWRHYLFVIVNKCQEDIGEPETMGVRAPSAQRKRATGVQVHQDVGAFVPVRTRASCGSKPERFLGAPGDSQRNPRHERLTSGLADAEHELAPDRPGYLPEPRF